MEKNLKRYSEEFVRSSLSSLFISTGVQQKDVAEFIGIDRSNLSHICTGKTLPLFGTYLSIVQACLCLSKRPASLHIIVSASSVFFTPNFL